ncbi:MAG: hypothetical protein SFW67_26910 [Myxococcaceae bacterium]|nr:hypothetical protein [Myxococcaceae bacterium]
MPQIPIPDPIRVARKHARLTSQLDPADCLPYWRWDVAEDGAYNPYIVQPVSVGTDDDRTLLFKPIDIGTGDPLSELSVALNDPYGKNVVSQLPATIDAWIAEGAPTGRFCLLFLTPTIADIIGMPVEAKINPPSDKWPLSAGGAPDPLTVKLLEKIVKAAEKQAVPKFSPAEVGHARRLLVLLKGGTP